MKRLIVNADGFGFTYGINRGIEEAVSNGIVTSISVVVNFNAIEELPSFISRHPEISVGVHVNPVVGRPVSEAREIPSLVNAHGEFHYREFTKHLRSGQIRMEHLELELSRQVERALELSGNSITHIDSHQNKHLYPGYFKVFIRVAKRYGITRMRTHRHLICVEAPNRRLAALAYYTKDPIRLLTHTFARYEMWQARRQGMRMADYLLSLGHIGRANKALLESWLNIVRNVPDGISEIYCHPGYVDDELSRYATYVHEREKEIEVLTNSALRDAINRASIELINFRHL